MKLTDYLVDFIAKRGTQHIFSVTGGSVAHLVDAIGRRFAEKGDLNYVCMQHEQAAAMAAENYSRIGPGIGVAIATSGPGATNLITGICDCYFDSIPALFITGQVNVRESIESVEGPLRPRQLGFQETDIVNIVKPITKYAIWISDPSRIRYELEKAYWIATTGRPGPVLIDLPMNLQVTDIDVDLLEGFTPPATSDSSTDPKNILRKKASETVALLSNSKRPVFLLGGGVKHAKAEESARILLEKLGIPVVVSWGGFDIIPHDHPLFRGSLGVYSNRAANFVIQNSDFILSVGSRLDSRQTGGKVDWFARNAKVVMVDIDPAEFKKYRDFKPAIEVCGDAQEFLAGVLEELATAKIPDADLWVKKTNEWWLKYPSVLPEYFNQPFINAYSFVRTLSDHVKPGEIIVVDEGGNLVWTMQSWQIKSGQKLLTAFANSPMGYAVPGAIGAAFAAPGKKIVCLDGDGGVQLNIQELQTIAHYKLPIKLFILNNRSMGIIKLFQDNYFDGRYYASTPEGGYSMPDFVKVAEAYGIDAFAVEKPDEMAGAIEKALKSDRPVICNVLIDTNQTLVPRLNFGRPLEDMQPYLPDEEFLGNMIVDPLPRKKEKEGWQKLE
ncbi:MAG: thiamine pyrophosphate-binding protein [Candidatus Liptonbacteria bacterium]|nr:thiamine pyrophosphate-binding protein [Candidatus Liptonbacteria bacterium]